VVVLPGRGERPGVYQRLGKRLAADAYRVRVVGDATEHLEEITVQVKALLGDADRPGPAVLVGSDTGALLALRLVARGAVAVDGLILAGLPDPDRRFEVSADAEAEVRASCPTHQQLLRDRERAVFQAGTLTSERIPGALREPVRPAQVQVPVLGLHGDNDQVSPLEWVPAHYAGLPQVELLTVADGRHDLVRIVRAWLNLASMLGRAPSSREVGAQVGLSHTTVQTALAAFRDYFPPEGDGT